MHEPQYQRLNEIMKWSALIGWLNAAGDGDRLNYLAGVDIDRSQVFDKWALRHPELRFTQWSKIGFSRAGYKGSTTEALPLLRGPITEGGVSLASRALGKQPSLGKDFDALIRRSSIDYAESDGVRTQYTLDRTTFCWCGDRRAVQGRGHGAAGRSNCARWARNSVGRGRAQRGRTAGRNGLLLQTRFDHAPLGDLAIDRGRNGIAIGWQSRVLEHAQDMARRLSMSGDAERALLDDSAVESVLRFDELDYAVKLRGLPEWIRFARAEAARLDLPAWVVGPGCAARRRQSCRPGEVVTHAELLDELRPKAGRFVVATDDDGHAIVSWAMVGEARQDSRAVNAADVVRR